MTTRTTPTTSVIPRPRTETDPARHVRRQRPPSEYWDVFEACWRTAAGAAPER